MNEFEMAVIESRLATLERLKKKMLESSGSWGVVVDTWEDGRWEASLSTEVTPMDVTYRRH